MDVLRREEEPGAAGVRATNEGERQFGGGVESARAPLASRGQECVQDTVKEARALDPS